MLPLWLWLLAAPLTVHGVDLTGQTPAELWELSDGFFHEGLYAEAIAVHQRIQQLDPHDQESYNVAAWLQWSLGDEPTARATLQRAVAANPDAWDSHWELGFHLFERVGDPAGALPSLETAIARTGWPPVALRTLAHAYFYAEQPSRAAAVWERALSENLAPPAIAENNLGRALAQALRTDLAARLGGVLSGEPDDTTVRVLSDRIVPLDAPPVRWLRTISLAAPDRTDGRPDTRIYLHGRPLIYKPVWSWVAIECDVNRDGQFTAAEMLLDEDGDGIAESLPPIAELAALRAGLTPALRRLLAPDRYELGRGEDGRERPLTVRLEGDQLVASPPLYLASEQPGLELRVVVQEIAVDGVRRIAAGPLRGGVYCLNQVGQEPQQTVAMPLTGSPPGQYAVALEIGYRTATLDQKRLGSTTLHWDGQTAQLTVDDAWARFDRLAEVEAEPAEESPASREKAPTTKGQDD